MKIGYNALKRVGNAYKKMGASTDIPSCGGLEENLGKITEEDAFIRILKEIE